MSNEKCQMSNVNKIKPFAGAYLRSFNGNFLTIQKEKCIFIAGFLLLRSKSDFQNWFVPQQLFSISE